MAVSLIKISLLAHANSNDSAAREGQQDGGFGDQDPHTQGS